jgi:hypothetical protein
MKDPLEQRWQDLELFESFEDDECPPPSDLTEEDLDDWYKEFEEEEEEEDWIF